MNSIPKWPLRIAIYAASSLGMILMSQAGSFARWNEYQTTGQNFNFHALLLFGSGIAICALAAGVGLLSSRLSHLEQRIKECCDTKKA